MDERKQRRSRWYCVYIVETSAGVAVTELSEGYCSAECPPDSEQEITGTLRKKYFASKEEALNALGSIRAQASAAAFERAFSVKGK